MKHKDLGYHELHCVQMRFRVIREGIETHGFEDSEYKEDGENDKVKYDACRNPIHATTQEDTNHLLKNDNKVDDDILSDPYSKLSTIGETNQTEYK